MNQAAEIEVNRLPWNLVSFITRALQFVWIGLGVMGALRETDAVVMDWQRSYIVEERRLKEELRFEELELDWPLGTFFRPEHLACSREGLLISSSFSHFMLQENSTGTSLKLKDIPSRSQMFCDPWKLCVRAEFPTSGQLLLHVNTTGRNEIHELRWPKTLRFYGGSVLPCAQLDAFASEPSCFLMVLGDEKDKSRLQIAWSRLPSSRRSMEAREMHLNFRNHSIQVAQAQATAQGLEKLAALDVNQGTLSLLFSSGRIEQWKLLGDQPEQVTSLMATWRHSKDDPFRPTALCSLCNTQFRMRVISYVAGHRARSQRPVLMRVVSQND